MQYRSYLVYEDMSLYDKHYINHMIKRIYNYLPIYMCITIEYVKILR